MDAPDWFAEIDDFESCRTVQANDGVIWAVVLGGGTWWYQERGGEPEAFDSLGGLVGRLSSVQRGLFGTSLEEAGQQDCLIDLITLLDRGDRAGALSVLGELVDPAEGVALPETSDDVCRRLAFALRQTLTNVASGKTAGLDQTLAYARLRLESASESKASELATILLEHEPARLREAQRVLRELAEAGQLPLLQMPTIRDDNENIVPGGPLCPELFADGRWATIEMATRPKHPSCDEFEVQRVPIPPPELRPSTHHEALQSGYAEAIRRLKNRVDRSSRLVELGAPDTIMENEARMEAEALAILVELSTLPTTSHARLEMRDEVRIETPPPGDAGPHVAYLERIWAPKLGDVRGATVLVQSGDNIRLYDKTGVIAEFPPCAWSLAAGDRQWAVFVGDNPRVENGEVREVAVLDTVSGEWRDTWPHAFVFEPERRLLATNTFTVAERIDNGWCVTDLLHNRSRVLELPKTELIAWSPMQDVLWAKHLGADMLLRTLGGAAPLPKPDEFDQVYDADSGELSRGRRGRGTTVEPVLYVDYMEGAVHVSPDGRIGVGPEPVLELEGTIDALAVNWPMLAVLTPSHLSVLQMDSFDEDGFGDDTELRWRVEL